MRITTLCIPVKDNEILLGIKKQKLGVGKYNAFGGHVEKGETPEQAAVRELQEEAGIIALNYEKVGKIKYSFTDKPDWNQIMHIYLVYGWAGEPNETNEMTCEWFSKDKIPYDKMWDNDKYWLPKVLAGENVSGSIKHNTDKTLKNRLRFSKRIKHNTDKTLENRLRFSKQI